MDSTKPPELTDAQLWRLVYSQWDFQQALSALTFLMEEIDFDKEYSVVQLRRFRCYETSLIVSFSRPFEPARRHSILGLKAIGVNLDSTEKLLKEKLLKLRREVVAHSDEDAMHFKGTAIKPFDDVEIKTALFTFHETLHLGSDDLLMLETLLHKLIFAIASTLFHVAQISPERLELYKYPN